MLRVVSFRDALSLSKGHAVWCGTPDASYLSFIYTATYADSSSLFPHFHSSPIFPLPNPPDLRLSDILALFLHTLPICRRTRPAQAVQRTRNIRPNDGNTARKPGDGRKEVAEQDQDTVQLDQEAEEGPAHQDERDAHGEGGGAFPFLAAREEGESFFFFFYEREAD